MSQRCVVTIAVGKVYYLTLAENLLLSFLIWNSQNDIGFLLITDNCDFFNKYKKHPKVTIKQIALDDTEKSFTSKFKLFENATHPENLFVDCDCLVYSNLTHVFEQFKQHNFSAIGNNITSGDFFCEVPHILQRFNLQALPKFVGSVYYFKKNLKAQEIFETAINLKNKYDELGFIRLRGKENEEPLFAVAMALNNEALVPNNGLIKADAMYYKRVYTDVLTGKIRAYQSFNEITGGEKIPSVATPAIFHFNSSFSDGYQYKAEAFKLGHSSNSLVAIRAVAYLNFYMPYQIKYAIKYCLRPLYHFLGGSSKIKQNNRI